MKNRITRLTTLAVMLAASANSVASDEETIVTATRQPTPIRNVLASTTVIDAADIRRLQPRDLPSLLSRMSGVDFRDSGGRGSVSGVFIRGAAPSQSLILIDGVRAASATVGATAIEGIPIESIERIELVKGPLSGLYGADAIGGVIQIFTKKGQATGIGAQLHARYRTDDTQDYTLELSGGNERGGIHASFSYENSAGIDRTSIVTGGNADRDGFDEFALNVAANYQLSDQIHAQLNLLRTDAHSEFDNLFGADRNHDSDNKVESNAFKLLYTPSARLRVSFDMGYFRDAAVTPVFGSDITTRRVSYTLQSDYKVHENHTITTGFEYYDDRVDTLSAFAETSRENIGGFFQWQGRYNKLAIVGSVRYDDNETYGDNTNGSVALEYQLVSNLAGIVSYGTAFRAPSFNDLFFPGFGNPNVRPEKSESVELGLKGAHFGVDWRLSGYYTEVDDLIRFDSFIFIPVNTAKATLQGVELEASSEYRQWRLTTNLNYLDARDDATDEFLDDRAEFAANVQLFRPFGQFELSFDLEAESGRHDRNGTQIDGFVIFGAGIHYQVNSFLRVAGRIDNLFDENYTLNLATSRDVFRTYGRTGQLSLHVSY